MRMRSLVPLILALVFCSVQGAVRAQSNTFVAALTGANETPPNTSPATGFATVSFNEAMTMLTYDVSFADLSAPLSVSHIHVGPAGVAGPVVLPFTGIPVGMTSGSFSGTLTMADLIPDPALGINNLADVATAMRNGNTYVNIHSTQFPGGEIRGQLAAIQEAIPEPGTLALAGMGALGLLVCGRQRGKRAA